MIKKCDVCNGEGKTWSMSWADNADVDEWDCDYCSGTGVVNDSR